MTNIGILGNPSTWTIGKMGVFPMEYKLPYPDHGMRLVRRPLRRQVDTAMPITPTNPEIRFKIPSSSMTMLDFRRGGILITVTCSVDAPWSVRPSHLIWNMFNRFRLEQHGQYIEDRQFFNLQETLAFWTQTLDGQFVTVGTAMYGAGSPALRASRANSWQYCIPIPTTALCKTILPWFQMVNLSGTYSSSNLPDVTMIWNVAAANEWLEVFGGTGPINNLSWSITNMEVEYEEVSMESSSLGRFMKMWHGETNPDPLPKIRWRTWLTNTYPLTVGLDQYIPLDIKVKSIVFIAVTVRDTTETYNPQITDRFESWIGPTNVESFPLLEYQWEINNNLWPDRPISLADPGMVQPYKKYLEVFSMYHARGIQEDVTHLTENEFLDSKFVMFFDANQHPYTPGLIGPLSTERSSKQIILRLKFNSTPASNLELVVHTFYWRSWEFGAPTGTIVDW
jgi:hypothetical protein